MIASLRKKFIKISAISILIVVSIIFVVLVATNKRQLDRTMDTLTDAIVSNNGVFPKFEQYNQKSLDFPNVKVITPETEYSTRFFAVWLDSQNHILKTNMDYVSEISDKQVEEYTEEAMERRKKRGWIEEYRYQIVQSDENTFIVFVNGAMNQMMMKRFIFMAFVVLSGSGIVILFLIILLSKRVVSPIAESYEKQKQFITDANHELKTPLTLILSNLDIVEAELGKNEWLDDIRSEGERMGHLVNRLVTLSRMDEENVKIVASEFDLSNAVMDTVSEYRSLAEERDKLLLEDVAPGILYKGEEGAVRQLLSILLDNAVKYCDSGGNILVCLSQKVYPVIAVENSYKAVDDLELDKLFDRFYRADKARTYDGSFGIGLSIARAIARKHHGEIHAYKRDGRIGFKVYLK